MTEKYLVPLSYEHFGQLVKTAPRNYSVIIMFTVLSEKRHCEMCTELLAYYEIIARSAYHNYGKRIYFTYVDYDSDPSSQKIFELFNINSVPVFMHVAADKIRFNDKFNDVPLVENLVKWINNRANLNVCC